MANDILQSIGQGLQSFIGKVPLSQIQNQAEQRNLKKQQQFMQLDNQRQGALFKDARVVNSFIKANQPEQALNFLSNRMNMIEQFGGDSSDTREVAEFIARGDLQGASSLLDSVEQAGVAGGFLESMEMDELSKTKLEKAKLELEELRNPLLKNKTKKQFEKQAQFEQLQELKKNGTPEQVKEFRTLIGLDKKSKLSSVAETALNKAQDNSFSADVAANKMELLARDIAKTDIGGGASAGWSETLKNLLGSQDEVSNLRREFRAIRSSQAVRNLPPGVASDKDIALALSGFPREDAPASEIISFLNGQSKLARMERTFNDFKSDYISSTGGISGFSKAWRKQATDKEFLDGVISIEQPTQAAEATQEVEKQGGKMMVDANGNKAIVFPDGSFKEVN